MKNRKNVLLVRLFGFAAIIAAVTIGFTALSLTGCGDGGGGGGGDPKVISIKAITGITAPATGGVPAGTITATDEYTGTISWKDSRDNSGVATFAARTAYTATITLTPKSGYTLTGVTANFFTVAGASASNAANSGVITAVFPQTGGTSNQTPTTEDFTISGQSHIYDGNPKTVTITPKQGKSGGAITIYYDGETAPPSDIGSYTVTFDVEAASGWNAVTGLSAGTLEIAEQTANPETPTAADFNVDNLSQIAGSVTAVTITPRQGKSEGQITVYYNGTATIPQTAGTYTVTFDIAEAYGWNAKTGLSAGTLEVIARTIISIAVTTDPTKTQYNIGDTLDTEGMVVTATYNDNSEEAVTGYTTSDLESTTTGEKTVTVTYEGKTATFTVTVITSGIETVAKPVPSPAAGNYNGTQSVTLTSATPGAKIYFTVDGKDPTTSSYSYTGSAITIPMTMTIKAIAVKEGMNNSEILTAVYTIKSLNNIEVTTQPTKSVYIIGETPLDTTGMVVTATYSDGTTEVVTGYTTSGFSSTTAGYKNINVSYQGRTTSFSVRVLGINYINVTTQPAKTMYTVGDTLDTTGMVITATYDDYSNAAVTGYTTSGFDSATAGIQTITVTYGGKTGTFTVAVGSGGVIDPSNITNDADFIIWLSNQPANDANTAYTVKLNVNNISNISYPVLFDNSDKYVNIDLSGSTITSIGNNAFSYRTNLTSIIIPDTITSIGSGVFQGCSNLASITIPFVGATLNGTTNTFFGYIFGASANNTQNSYIPASLKTVIITGGTKIADYAFFGCSGLTSVTIPDSVTSIGASAFQGCSSLTSVTIPDSVNSIRLSTFQGCSSLTSVTIPDTVTSIEYGAFQGCSKLASITIPDRVTSIGQNAFYSCGLTSVTIPDSVNSIENSAFQGCTGLTSLTIGSGVTSIGNSAFYECINLASVIIPDNVTSIGNYAFKYCSNLTSVTFEGADTIINGTDVFINVDSTSSLTFEYSAKYSAGGIGTYTRSGAGTTFSPYVWTKQ